MVPDPDPIDRLVTLLDDVFREGGWYQPHQLVMVEDDDSDSGEPGFKLGVNPLPEGDHPLEHLMGFVAPAEWRAFGVVCFGWAAPPEGDVDVERGTVTRRPSQHPQRQRARLVTLLDRTGDERSTTALEDGTVIDSPGEGTVSEALHRCLELPTNPPSHGPEELFATWWLQTVVAANRPLSWSEVAALHPASTFRGDLGFLDACRALSDYTSWDDLRVRASRVAARTPFAVEPRLAQWMDDGMFSRWVLSTYPSLASLLVRIRRQVGNAVTRRIERSLREWNLQPRGAARGAA